LRVIADENIPQISDALDGVADVRLMQGRQITRDDIAEADALLVRSITKVNLDLLEGTAVKFVGSATIGMDHLDENYLEQNKITYTNAAGCNANSVVEYVICAILEVAVRKNIKLEGKTLGIIGKGNIGRPLSERIKLLGMKVKCCDPPLEEKGEEGPWFSHEEILKSCEFVTYHVPITKDGNHPTYHLLNKNNLGLYSGHQTLINACRGPVFNNSDLLDAMNENVDRTLILDVWENEPGISMPLLEKTMIATPHIAGYSQEGKLTGTEVITKALFEKFGITKNWKAKLPEPENKVLTLSNSKSGFKNQMHDICLQAYRLHKDDQRLRETKSLSQAEAAKAFDVLRKTYPVRREFNAFRFRTSGLENKTIATLEALGFQKV